MCPAVYRVTPCVVSLQRRFPTLASLLDLTLAISTGSTVIDLFGAGFVERRRLSNSSSSISAAMWGHCSQAGRLPRQLSVGGGGLTKRVSCCTLNLPTTSGSLLDQRVWLEFRRRGTGSMSGVLHRTLHRFSRPDQGSQCDASLPHED